MLSYSLFPFIFGCCLLGLPLFTNASRVNISNNGYDDLLVAISSSVPANQSQIIIDNIKSMINQAAPVLYKATLHRATFRSVRILIPENWMHVEANASSWETFQTADVRIDTANPVYGNRPYTIQLGGCGERGEYIHLTPEYVASLHEQNNVEEFGKPGKVFVHEWAHLRYGVFNEYGEPGNPNYPLFYRQNGSNSIVPNICADGNPSFYTRDITDNGDCKIDPVTQLYDENCRFFFDESFKPLSSLASIHQIDSVEHFCENNQKLAHQFDAPNRHNDKCNRKSVQAVISENPDFSENKNPPVDLSRINIDFQIVRPPPGAGNRFILVADVSGSMALCKRIEKLRESTRIWIKHDLPVGSKLGIVQFSAAAHILSELEEITDMKSREALMSKVPKELFSATCIGCGLSLATQMLTEKNMTGGIILLVTDGANSPGYHGIYDVMPQILKAGIRVVTIAFGEEADKCIETLAELTEGKSYYVHDTDTSDSVSEAFLGALTYQSGVAATDVHVKLYEKMATTEDQRQPITGHFNVDYTLGRNLKLKLINLGNGTKVDNITLTGPNGEHVPLIEYDGTTASVTVPLAQTGKWNFNAKLAKPQSDPIQLTVTAQLLPNVSVPITTRCWVANGADVKNASSAPIRIHAQAWKGFNPIVGAAVKAYIEKPNEDVEIVDLLDNGVNADAFANDGVYSKYFVTANEPGRYSLKCQIWDNNGLAHISLGFIGSPSPVLNEGSRKARHALNGGISQGSSQLERLENFNRITSGGSFKIDIPVSIDDAYPPGHVTDLTISSVHHAEGSAAIEMRWTAPGDELDSGTVSGYELKFTPDASKLLDINFELMTRGDLLTKIDSTEGSLQLEEAGALQTFTLHVNDVAKNRVYYIAIRAIDKASRTSRISNFATFFIPEERLPVVNHEVIEEDATNERGNEVEENEIEENEIEEHDESNHGEHHLAVLAVIGIGLSVALGGALLLLIVIQCVRRSHAYKTIPIA